MAKRKSITVTATHERKRWQLTISGTDHKARKAIITSLMALERKDNGGFAIVNGASWHGDESEGKKRAKKAVADQPAAGNGVNQGLGL